MKSLLFSAILVFLASAGGAEAAPVVAAVQVVAAWVAGLSAFSIAVLQIAIGTAMSLIAKAKMRRAQRDAGVIQTDVTLTGGTNSETFILGYYATAGTWVCPPLTHGERNKFLTYAIDLAGLPGHTLEEVFINGEKLVLDGAIQHGVTVSSTQESFKGLVSLTYFDGSQTSAPQMMLDNYGSHPDFPWSSDMVGRDRCFVIMEFETDNEVFSGLPQARFALRGIPIFDPRDGGVRQTDNLGLLSHAVLRGVQFPDGSRWGGEAGLSDLPISAWASAMNEADRLIDTADGGSEAQFRGGFEVKIAEVEPAEVLERFMDACTGDLAEEGGIWHVRIGAPTLPSAFLTDADLIVDAPMALQPFASLSETQNGLTLKFPNPASAWEVTESERILRADLEAEDEGRRLMGDLSLSACPYALQVQRVGQAYIEDSRRDVVHSVTLPPDFAHLPPLSVVAWTSDHNQYDAKQFSIEKKIVHAHDLLSAVELREVNPSDHSWSTEDELPVPFGITIFTDPGAYVLSELDVRPIKVYDSEGQARHAAISVSNIPDLPGVEWRLRDSSGLRVADGVAMDVGDSFVISQGVLPAQTYFVGFRVAGGGNVDWSQWYGVETDDVRIAPNLLDEAVWAAVEESHLDAVAPLFEDLHTNTITPLARNLELQEVAGRTAAEAIAVIGDQILWAVTRLSDVDQRFADAGIVVDAETGKVRIYAVEEAENRVSETEIRLDAAEGKLSLSATQAWVNEQITQAVLDPSRVPLIDDLNLRVTEVEADLDAAQAELALSARQTDVDGHAVRLNSAEAELDAVNAAIELKADRSQFDDLSGRVQTAEVQIEALDGGQIVQTVSDTRHLLDASDTAAVQTLAGLLQAHEEGEQVRQDIAYATQDLRARINEDRSAVAEMGLSLGVAIDGAVALVEAETKARVSVDEALASDVATLDSRLRGAEGEIEGQATAQQQLSTLVTNLNGQLDAQAESIVTLTTQRGEDRTVVQAVSESVNGMLGRHMLSVNVNGVVTGMVIGGEAGDDGEVDSNIAFSANTFTIAGADGAGEVAPFSYFATGRTVGGIYMPAGVYLERANIGRAAIGRAQIADVIQSDNYAESSGLPTVGMKLNFATGEVRAAGTAIFRDQVLARGSFTVQGRFSDGAKFRFVNTGIRVSASDVRSVTTASLVADAGIVSFSEAASGFDGYNGWWVAACRILNGPRWFGFTGSNPQPSISYRKDPSQLVTPPWATGSDQRVWLEVELILDGIPWIDNPRIDWIVKQVT